MNAVFAGLLSNPETVVVPYGTHFAFGIRRTGDLFPVNAFAGATRLSRGVRHGREKRHGAQNF